MPANQEDRYVSRYWDEEKKKYKDDYRESSVCVIVALVLFAISFYIYEHCTTWPNGSNEFVAVGIGFFGLFFLFYGGIIGSAIDGLIEENLKKEYRRKPPPAR